MASSCAVSRCFITFPVALRGSAATTWTVRGLPGLVAAAAIAALAYTAAVLSVMRTPPLGPMLTAAIQPWISIAHAALKRLAGQPLTQSQ